MVKFLENHEKMEIIYLILNNVSRGTTEGTERISG
jgi:hypothetical protein